MSELVVVVEVRRVVDADRLRIVLPDVVGDDGELVVRALRAVGEDVRVHRPRRRRAVPVGGELAEPVLAVVEDEDREPPRREHRLRHQRHVDGVLVVLEVDDEPHLEAFAAHDGGQDVVEPPLEDLVLQAGALAQRQDAIDVAGSRHLPVERGFESAAWAWAPAWGRLRRLGQRPRGGERREGGQGGEEDDARRAGVGHGVTRWGRAAGGHESGGRGGIIRSDRCLAGRAITILSPAELRARN